VECGLDQLGKGRFPFPQAKRAVINAILSPKIAMQVSSIAYDNDQIAVKCVTEATYPEKSGEY
jgi:hypothetical protein